MSEFSADRNPRTARPQRDGYVDAESPRALSSVWLGRPLCRRYSFVQLRALAVVTCHSAEYMRCCWGFGMLTGGRFELLGAWALEVVTAAQIFDDLTKRGVERINILSADLMLENRLPLTRVATLNVQVIPTPLRVESLTSPDMISLQFLGRKRRTLLSAVSTGDRLNGRLMRALRQQPALASYDAAFDFVAEQLARADLGLFDLSHMGHLTAPHTSAMTLIGVPTTPITGN